jgi:hypothetical protein
MAWWRLRNAQMIDGVRTGGELPPSVEDDTQNDVIYKTSRDRTASDVRAEARASWDRLIDAVEACSEADLMKPYPYGEGRALWESIPGHGHGHLAQHLMFWYLESGDEVSAEEAQLWVRELENSTSASDRQRAHATYNLACFYGRVGRAGVAVPLLRESLGADPGLVELARRDPDLDPIRGDGEVAELLAG